MALHINDENVERLAEELAHLTGESTTAAVRRALEERRERIAGRAEPRERRLAQVRRLLETEIWPSIPPELLGRPMTTEERERILGYGEGGV